MRARKSLGSIESVEEWFPSNSQMRIEVPYCPCQIDLEGRRISCCAVTSVDASDMFSKVQSVFLLQNDR